MLQPLCEHLSRFDENFIPKESIEGAFSQNEKDSYEQKCCEEHIWTFIKKNQLDKIHAFIRKINDSIFDSSQINFNINHAEEQTKKGILLKYTYVPFTGLAPRYTFSTPFGKIDFPLTEIPRHKTYNRFCSFIAQCSITELKDKKESFTRTFSLNYSEDSHQVEPHLVPGGRSIEVLSKIWKMLETKYLMERKLPRVLTNRVSPNNVKEIKLMEEVPYINTSYYKTTKFGKNGETKTFTNGARLEYILSLQEFEKEKSKENSRYALNQAEVYKSKFKHCNIALLDGRQETVILNEVEIGVLLKEICPKVLINCGYEVCRGKVLEAKLVNRNAEEILTALFQNVTWKWCGTR